MGQIILEPEPKIFDAWNRCQAKFLAYYYLSVILPFRVKV